MFNKTNKTSSTSSEKANSKKLEERIKKLGIDPSGIPTVVLKRLEETMLLPIPGIYSYWNISEQIVKQAEKNEKRFGIFKKKELPQKTATELREQASESPGNTRIKILKLKKKFPENSTLGMLSAVCREQMMINSATEKKDRLIMLRSITREAAKALSNDGASIYNCESFLKIYFSLMDHFKRNQVNFYGVIHQDLEMEPIKKHVVLAMKYRELITVEQEKLNRMIAHLKNKFRSSTYVSPIDYKLIHTAIQAVDKGEEEKKLSIGIARDIVSATYAIGVIFAHIPVMSTMVDNIINLFPSANIKFQLRKVSIKSIRNFMNLKLASVTQNGDQMRAIAREIFRENKACVQAMKGIPIRHAFESDPFMNLAYLTVLSVGLFKQEEKKRLVDSAISAMRQVMTNDRSSTQKLTVMAGDHLVKLTTMQTEMSG